MDIVGQTSGIGDAPWWSGAGYGFGGGRFADFGSNAVRINAAERASAVGFENLLDQNQFATISGNITTSCNRVTDSIVNGEFRNGDRLRDLERVVLDGQRDAAKCCCELKLENCKNTAELKALIIEENSKTREQIRGDALSAANAELTALKTQIACGCCKPASSQG